jgi:hypothetical protein
MAIMKSYSGRMADAGLERPPITCPGAGAYELRSSLQLTQSRIPFGRIGRGLRESADLNKFPGPGSYRCDKDQFLYTHYKNRITVFDKRKRDSIADPPATEVPGPGSYISLLDLDVDIPNIKKISMK